MIIEMPYTLIRGRARKRQRRLEKQRWMQACRKAEKSIRKRYVDYNRRIVDHIHTVMWKILLGGTPEPLTTYMYSNPRSSDKARNN